LKSEAKKLKKKWNTIRRKKSNRGKKFQKKENGGETPKSAESKKKVTTTTIATTAPSAGGKRKRRMTESFNAPFNSTQFLMNDHKTEAVRHLDSTLNGGRGEGQTEVNVDDENSVDISMAERPQRRITRARESSFSIDSDEDYYYSSPEDEEEFMSREFIKDYDNLRNDRLIDMSKSELINEYLQMEERIEALEKRLSRQNSTSQTTTENDTKLEEEQENTSDSNSKEAMADTISKFQKEIQRLESENDKLKLVQAVHPPIPQQHIPPGCSSSCSSCSESDSESDSDSDSDDSSESEDNSDMEEEKEETKQVFDTILREKSRQIGEVEGDTGYESGHSNKPVTKNASISNLNDEGIDPNDTTEDKPENTNEIESEPESCPELISVNCITSTSP
jgi:protein HEXIM1/2